MFEIRMGNTVVGSADISQQGLYYHIKCTCHLPNDQMYRMLMRCGDVHKDLGICVPEGNVFRVFTRIPVKNFKGKDFTFEIVCGTKGEYIISNNTPFGHLDKLESARLQNTNGQIKIVIDSVPVPQDNDLNQEHLNR